MLTIIKKEPDGACRVSMEVYYGWANNLIVELGGESVDTAKVSL